MRELRRPLVGAWGVPISKSEGAEDSFKRLDALLEELAA
jgi:hypothetical protein